MPTSVHDLRTGILAAREDHRFWSSPHAHVLLSVALERLTPIARRFAADPADALSYAFEVWTFLPESILEDATCDMWAYTASAVRHAFERDAVAEAKGTSASAARRADASEVTGFTALDDIDPGYTPFEVDADPETGEVPEPHRRALAVLDGVLILAGLTEDQRQFFIDVLAEAVSGSPSPRATLARAAAARDAVCPQMTPGQWKNLTEIVFGTPSGKPGVLVLAATGNPAPALEPHITSRLAGVLGVTA